MPLAVGVQMPRPMRRSFSLVADLPTLESWLEQAQVGRLATVDRDGYPLIKPVNFIYDGGRVFFHSALEGEKLDDIRRDPRVGFEVDRLYTITPPLHSGCQTHCLYHSIVARGRARVLDAPADAPLKERALRLLVEKYAGGDYEFRLEDVPQTAVVEITIEHMTGKEDIGQKWSRERRLSVARKLLERDGLGAHETIERLGLSLEEVSGYREA